MNLNDYQVLGLKPGASQDDMRAAYKCLVKRFHPDVSGDEGTSGRLQQVLEAYKRLTERGTSARQTHLNGLNLPACSLDEVLHNLARHAEPEPRGPRQHHITLPFAMAVTGGRLDLEGGGYLQLAAGCRSGDMVSVLGSTNMLAVLVVEEDAVFTRRGRDLLGDLVLSPEKKRVYR